MIIYREDPASVVCRIDWRGVTFEHDPVLPYNTLQQWSFCQRCGCQIYRVDCAELWRVDEAFAIEEWP